MKYSFSMFKAVGAELAALLVAVAARAAGRLVVAALAEGTAAWAPGTAAIAVWPVPSPACVALFVLCESRAACPQSLRHPRRRPRQSQRQRLRPPARRSRFP